MTTDWPEAVRELKPVVWTGEFADCGPMYRKSEADAAIAALKEMVENARWAGKQWREQAEAAEAEVRDLIVKAGEIVGGYEAKLEKAEAEVERLKRMLRLAAQEWVEDIYDPSYLKVGRESYIEERLADLAARYEKEHKS